MPSSARNLYQSFIAKGLSKEEAFFAVMDAFNDQHWYDRNRYHERLNRLEQRAGTADEA